MDFCFSSHNQQPVQNKTLFYLSIFYCVWISHDVKIDFDYTDVFAVYMIYVCKSDNEILHTVYLFMACISIYHVSLFTMCLFIMYLYLPYVFIFIGHEHLPYKDHLLAYFPIT